MTIDPQMTASPEFHGSFNPQGIGIPVIPLLRMQGYRDVAKVRPQIRAIAEQIAERAEGLAEVQVHFRTLGVRSCTDDVLTLETGVTFHGTTMAKALAGSEAVLAFVLTVGEQFDTEGQALTQDEDLLGALFLESAGWLGVEKATRALSGHLKALAAEQGYRLGRRVAPGYGDWNLEEQKDLFALFGDDPLPVRLLDSCAMLPKMSRSGMYGLLPAAGMPA